MRRQRESLEHENRRMHLDVQSVGWSSRRRSDHPHRHSIAEKPRTVYRLQQEQYRCYYEHARPGNQICATLVFIFLNFLFADCEIIL